MLLTFAACFSPARADESIDTLLNKLPPPQKIVRPRVQQAMQDPATKDPLVTRALAAGDAGDNGTALRLGRELAQKSPNSWFAHSFHAACALDAEQWDEARGAAQKSLSLGGNHGLVHLMLGVSEMNLGHYAAALPSLEQTNKLQATWAVGWLLASVCAEHLGRHDQSIAFAKRGTSIEQDWIYTWIQLGRAEKAAGHPQETLNAIVRAAALSPSSAGVLEAVGYSYINLNRIAQAIQPLDRAAKIDTDNYLLEGQLGYCLEMTGQPKAAVSHLRKSVSLNPNYGPGWEQLGLAYLKLGQHYDAIKAYDRATQLVPNSRHAWQNLAAEYRAVGRGADAQRALAHVGGTTASPMRIAKRK